MISGNDPQKVREICSDIHQRRISDEWVINVTGGTKPASFACLQYFAEQGVPVYYVDSNENRLMRLSPGPISYEPFNQQFKLLDIFRAHGQEVHKIETDTFDPGIRVKFCEKLYELNSNWKFKDFLGKVPLDVRQGKKRSFTMIKENGKLEIQPNSVLLEWKNQSITNVPGPNPGKFVVSGDWFEEYVYLLLKKMNFFNEIAMRVTFDWKTQPAKGVKNELDIVGTKNERLYIIECKSGNVKQDDINKIRNYKQIFGGSFCIPIIVTHHSPSKIMIEKMHENQINHIQLKSRIVDFNTLLAKMKPDAL